VFSLAEYLPKPTYEIEFENLREETKGMNFAGVYVWVLKSGEIAYTGRAKNIRYRLLAHLRDSHSEGLIEDIQNNRISHVLIFPCKEFVDAAVLERYFIEGNHYRGIHNKEYVTHDDYEYIQQENEVQKEIEREEQQFRDALKTLTSKVKEALDNLKYKRRYLTHNTYGTQELIMQYIKDFLCEASVLLNNARVCLTEIIDEYGEGLPYEAIDAILYILSREKINKRLERFGYSVSRYQKKVYLVLEEFVQYKISHREFDLTVREYFERIGKQAG
jgi:GIY-YIG catalytic domain